MTAFIQDTIQTSGKVISMQLSRFSEQIQMAMKFEVMPNRADYTSIKEQYEKIVNHRLSKAHIYLLDYFEFNKFYVAPVLGYGDEMPRRNDADELSCASERWMHIFDSDRVIYIVGGAGYGKSLFLKNVILNFDKMSLFGKEERLIIHGDLKNFVDGNGNTKTVMRYFQDCLVNSSGMGYTEFTEDFIKHYLDSGSCIILLDALDEVREENRNEVHEIINSFLYCQNPNNKICITSRSRGFIKMREECTVLYIQPLTTEQINSYIDNIIHLGRFDECDKTDFVTRTRTLIDKGFLRSCLILSLLVKIYRAERALPDNKLDLYQKCFEYISYKREVEEKKNLGYNWDRVQPLMNEDTFTRLAQLCAPNNQEIEGDKVKEALVQVNISTFESRANAINAVIEFLKFCANRTELFVPGANEDTFKFFHRSFLDYFYALHIFKYVNDVEEVYNELRRFGYDSEIYELLLSLLKNRKRATYDRLVQHVIDKTKCDFECKMPTYDPINILSLFLQEVTEKIYKDQIMNILITNPNKVSKRTRVKKETRNFIIDYHDNLRQMIIDKARCDIVTKDNFVNTYREFALIDLTVSTGEVYRFIYRAPDEKNVQIVGEWFRYSLIFCAFYTSAYMSIVGINSVAEDLEMFSKTERFGRINAKSKEIIRMYLDEYKTLTEENKKEIMTKYKIE
jgi:hypothetical protein